MRTAIPKNEGMSMNAQAKFFGPVHEKYHLCEQRMIWRGCTFEQSNCLYQLCD